MNNEIKNFKKEFPLSKFGGVSLSRGEFETGMILAKSTVSVRKFFEIHYQGAMKRPCYVNMTEHVGLELGNDYIFKLSGCAICPLKTPIDELIEYYPENSYAWCPIYNLRTEHLDLSKPCSLPENKKRLQKILQQYLELQKLILKHKATINLEDPLSLQDFLDEIIERLKDDTTKQLQRGKS